MTSKSLETDCRLPAEIGGEEMGRRRWMALTAGSVLLAGSATLPITGCVATGGPASVDLVWGRRGFSDGRFLKPRAITIDPDDQLYIVDTTGRIQVFDTDGVHKRTFSVPDTANGRPTGLAFDSNRSRLLVADTHYYRMLVFRPDGTLCPEQQIGGESGFEPGQFAFVTDAVSDQSGNLYVGEYGASDRIQKFDADGEFVCQWGGTGSEVGRFLRPQSLVIDGQSLWIADACNHRIVQYDLSHETPKWVQAWGVEGSEVGRLHYPYDLAVERDGTILVCEYGNQRIQRFSADGRPLSAWGSPGHAPGQLYQPWGVVTDSAGRIHVLDSNNHRVQRVLRV